MFQTKSNDQLTSQEAASPETHGVGPLHFVPQPRSITYALRGHELKASIIPRADDVQMDKVSALRERLFGHYELPGSPQAGDRDDFDKEPTFHVLLECNGEPIGVARLQPVSTRDGTILPHLSANFSLFNPRDTYDDRNRPLPGVLAPPA
jgi:hypothetical protein